MGPPSGDADTLGFGGVSPQAGGTIGDAMFEHWEPAEGTVVDRRQKGSSQSKMSANLHFLVEVRPTAGEPFRVELGMPVLSGDFIPPPSARW